MNATQLEEFTASISQFDTHRPYIGLSNIYLEPATLIDHYLNGQTSDLIGKLKCYKGYQMEKDLVGRIQSLYKDRISFREIEAFDGLIKGHPDFWYDNIPGDTKSVLMDDWFPDEKLPRKIYWQLQGYMLYGNSHKAIVVYESRESGRIKHKWVNRNEIICREIKVKVESIVNKLKEAVEL